MTLQQQCVLWSEAPELVHTLHPMVPNMHDAASYAAVVQTVSYLMQAQGTVTFTETSEWLTTNQGALAALEQHGLMTSTQRADTVTCALTQAGFARVRVCSRLHRPRAALAVQLDKDAWAMDRYELLGYLRHTGWTVAFPPRCPRRKVLRSY